MNEETPLSYLIRIVSDLEKFFKYYYNATGNGLGALYSSVQSRIPAECKQKVRSIADIRNTVIHNNDNDVAKQKIDYIVRTVNEIYKLCGRPDIHYPYYNQLKKFSQSARNPDPTLNPKSSRKPKPSRYPNPSKNQSPRNSQLPSNTIGDKINKLFDFLSDWVVKGCSFLIFLLFCLFLFFYLLNL